MTEKQRPWYVKTDPQASNSSADADARLVDELVLI